MSAEVIRFPARQAEARKPLAVGDLLVTCFNATLGLWCAWPVAAVDDDGVPMGVRLKNGKVLAADRVSCRAEAFGFRQGDHADGCFERLAWHTWPSSDAALEAFGGPC